MAITKSVYPNMGGSVNNTTAATFIPEIWSDEVRAQYEKSLVLANLVKKMGMTGKKGDTINIPAPVRGTATAKAAGTAVSIQSDTEENVAVLIDKHFEYSRLIEDITATQALTSLRQFYTQDAGYALARQVDSDLHGLAVNLGDAAGDYTNTNSYYVDASTGLTQYAADTVTASDVFTDAGFRALIQKMDDADVPFDNRCFVIPPSLRNAIMGIDRYVSSDFVSGAPVQNGKIGNLYGIDVFVSTNCAVSEAAADNSANTNDLKAALLLHKDTFVLAEQMGVRSQTQYKQEFLANLYTADQLYGVKVLRPESGFVLNVNA
jgi:N4-gp56 family major capsid protein